ncbi:LPXTG cell wall anchor domain-containing protein [Microbacterium sp. bgisy203]
MTVTNTLRSELPATGGSVPWWAIALGGGLVLVGAVSLIVASRRRKTGA